MIARRLRCFISRSHSRVMVRMVLMPAARHVMSVGMMGVLRAMLVRAMCEATPSVAPLAASASERRPASAQRKIRRMATRIVGWRFVRQRQIRAA